MTAPVFRRGGVVVVAHLSTSFSPGRGAEPFASAYLAEVVSVSRDGALVRSIRSSYGMETANKRDHHCPVPGVDAGIVDAFRYESFYRNWEGETAVFHRPVTVFGDTVAEVTSWLADAAQRWALTGEVPRGDRADHPDTIHLARNRAAS